MIIPSPSNSSIASAPHEQLPRAARRRSSSKNPASVAVLSTALISALLGYCAVYFLFGNAEPARPVFLFANNAPLTIPSTTTLSTTTTTTTMILSKNCTKCFNGIHIMMNVSQNELCSENFPEDAVVRTCYARRRCSIICTGHHNSTDLFDQVFVNLLEDACHATKGSMKNQILKKMDTECTTETENGRRRSSHRKRMAKLEKGKRAYSGTNGKKKHRGRRSRRRHG